MTRDIDIKYEFYRKLIHIVSTIIPVIYILTSKDFIVTLVGTGTILMVGVDLLKRYSKPFGRFYNSIFGKILRPDERNFDTKLFTGGTYYAFGIFLSLVFFTKEIAVVSILTMIWSDTLAAIFGRYFGRVKIYGNKTLEGSIMFFVSGVLIFIILSLLLDGYFFWKAALIALFVTTLFELFVSKINDNLAIPLVYGFITTLLIKFI
ncbi:MAG: SEC59/DGK1/VTE5 family protein [Ignavibacteria bacterium]|nr:SEC59/DGK1/VTE5 family protein [Ignavibacteria bacterium]